MDDSLVYISILNWQRYNDTIRCVKLLQQLSYSNYKILIRDNNSLNNSVAELQKAFPEYTIYLTEENDGYAAGHLENWKIAKEEEAEYFWILNSDIEVFQDSLCQLMKIAKGEKNAILGSMSLDADNHTLIDFGGGNLSGSKDDPLSYNVWKGVEYTEYLQKYPSYREVQSIEGSSILLPSTIIKKYGFIKTNFFMYGEETDYCLFLKDKKIKSILASKSLIAHKKAASFNANKAMQIIPAYYRRRNFIRIMQTHFDWSFWKCLNYPESVITKAKFLIIYFCSRKQKKEQRFNYYYLLATLHAVFNVKGKTITPENYLEK